MKTHLLKSAFLILALAVFSPSPLRAAAPESIFFNILDYGAKPDGQAKCTDAIDAAIQAAQAKGGGTIYFPPGTFLTGPIHLQSNITLFIDAGAVVKFSTDFNDYLPMVPSSRWEGIEVMNFSPLIYANKAKNICITGHGTLDGQGKTWWDALNTLGRGGAAGALPAWREQFNTLNAKQITAVNYPALNRGYLRPPFIQPYDCEHVLIEGVTIVNSPFWTVTPVYCDDVTIHAVTIKNPTSPNTDGINPDSCRHVRISDCNISVGDDCVTIKSGRDADGRRVNRPAEDYTIMNCTMAAGHGGVTIGSEMSGGVRNIAISNCVFDGTDCGIRIKSTRGRGGVVENVRVSNIIMRNIKNEAVLLTMFYERSAAEPLSERTPVFRNIHISGITGTARIAATLIGLGEMPIQDVELSDIHLDTRTGISLKDAKDIELHDIKVNTEQGPIITATDTAGLEISGLRTAKPHADAPVIRLTQTKQTFIHACTAAPGTGVFVQTDAASAAVLTMEANDLAGAKTVKAGGDAGPAGR